MPPCGWFDATIAEQAPFLPDSKLKAFRCRACQSPRAPARPKRQGRASRISPCAHRAGSNSPAPSSQPSGSAPVPTAPSCPASAPLCQALWQNAVSPPRDSSVRGQGSDLFQRAPPTSPNSTTAAFFGTCARGCSPVRRYSAYWFGDSLASSHWYLSLL